MCMVFCVMLGSGFVVFCCLLFYPSVLTFSFLISVCAREGVCICVACVCLCGCVCLCMHLLSIIVCVYILP